MAALTLPALIQKNNNRVVETRLMKFYSAINQAVKMAETDYGDKKIWWSDLTGASFDDDGNPVEGSSEAEKWFNKYLKPYVKVIKQETLSDGTFIVYFPDGSALNQMQRGTTRDWLFYPGNVTKCLKQYPKPKGRGICEFAFNFQPTGNESNWKYHLNKGFEPWKWVWDGTRETLLRGCKDGVSGSSNHEYCTSLIQYNGWKIPEDYPYKVSY